MKKLLFLLAAILFISAACNPSQIKNVTTLQNESSQQQNSQPTTTPSSNYFEPVANEPFVIRDKQIFDIGDEGKYDKLRGWINNDQLTIIIDKDFKVTFPGTTDSLNFFSLFSYPMFYFNNAQVGLDLVYPNSGYHVSKINYSCDGRFAQNYGESKDYYYCQTNNKDQISQYEFTGASAIGFGTGGGYGVGWSKMYAKHINGKDVFVTLMLEGDGLDVSYNAQAATDPKFCQEYQFKDEELCSPEAIKHYKYILSKEYLDVLLKQPKNQQFIKSTDVFFENLKAAKD